MCMYVYVHNTFPVQTYKELKEEGYFVLISLWVPHATNTDFSM